RNCFDSVLTFVDRPNGSRPSLVRRSAIVQLPMPATLSSKILRTMATRSGIGLNDLGSGVLPELSHSSISSQAGRSEVSFLAEAFCLLADQAWLSRSLLRSDS